MVLGRQRLPLLAAAVGIVILAACLRLWRLDLVEFKNDEAAWLRLTEDMVRLGRVPLVGEESSIGIRNPPDFVYFLSPIAELTRDPRVASAAVALANVVGIGGTMLLGWTRFSPLVGLVAGLTYATNPWAVFFARKVWNQDVVAPLAVLLFVALDRGVIAEEPAWAAAAYPIFMVGVQLHASLAVLAPLLLGLLVYLVVKRRWKPLAIGLVLAGLSLAPYLYFNYRTGWTELITLRNSLSRPPIVDGEGPAFVIGLASGWNNWSLVGVHLDELLPGWIASIPGTFDTVLLGIGLVAAVVLAFLPGSAQRRQRLRLAAVVLWLVLPAVLTVRHGIALYDHYFLFVPPAAALLIGLGVRWVTTIRRWSDGLRFLAAGGLVAVSGIQTLLVVRELQVVAGGSVSEYGPPLALSEALAQDLVGFGSASGSSHLAVELEASDSESMAYLARPSFADVDLVKIGTVGLGSRRSGVRALDGAPSPTILSPFSPLDLGYADSVQVLSAANMTRAVSGERVGLAWSWLANDASLVQGNRVQWQVSLLDPAGEEIAGGTGLEHVVTPAATHEVVLSWFALQMPDQALPGVYHLRVRRVEGRNSQPLQFARATGEVATDWTSDPIEITGRVM